MSTTVNDTVAKLRERLVERADYAAYQLDRHRKHVEAIKDRPRTATRIEADRWSDGFWTGAMDSFGLALIALDCLVAAEAEATS